MAEAPADDQRIAPTPRPGPATVRYNDWPDVAVPPAGAFEPTLGVSVVVPYFEAPGKLALTLAGLERQSYPRELFEVVIVDDGSEPPLAPPATPLDARVVIQENLGFGLARARNNGARTAKYDILVFLDGDMIPEAGWLAAHARWHHSVSDAMTLGFYARVSAVGIDAASIRHRSGSLRELFADRDFDPPWVERHVLRTGNFTTRHDDLFRAVSGGNLGIGKAFFESLGGFDETFDRHGGEDTEFGYRGQTGGGVLVPVPGAFAWHQGRWIEDRATKRRSATGQRAKLGGLIAHPGFRALSPERPFAVPMFVVTIPAEGAAEQVAALVEDVLADPARDLVVRIESRDPATEDRRKRVAKLLGPNSRVRFPPSGRSPLDEFPASPYHIEVPSGTDYRPGLVWGIHSALGTNVQATCRQGDSRDVVIARAWARHRARRTGLGIDHFGDTLDLDSIPIRRRVPRTRWSAGSTGLAPSPLARTLAEARQIRNLRGVWLFLRWFARGFRWWLARGRKVGRSARGGSGCARERPANPAMEQTLANGVRPVAVRRGVPRRCRDSRTTPNGRRRARVTRHALASASPPCAGR